MELSFLSFFDFGLDISKSIFWVQGRRMGILTESRDPSDSASDGLIDGVQFLSRC